MRLGQLTLTSTVRLSRYPISVSTSSTSAWYLLSSFPLPASVVSRLNVAGMASDSRLSCLRDAVGAARRVRSGADVDELRRWYTGVDKAEWIESAGDRRGIAKGGVL